MRPHHFFQLFQVMPHAHRNQGVPALQGGMGGGIEEQSAVSPFDGHRDEVQVLPDAISDCDSQLQKVIPHLRLSHDQG